MDQFWAISSVDSELLVGFGLLSTSFEILSAQNDTYLKVKRNRPVPMSKNPKFDSVLLYRQTFHHRFSYVVYWTYKWGVVTYDISLDPVYLILAARQ